jgi:hypothetical protein
VYISRDVVFDEDVFPFLKLHPNAGYIRAKISLLPPSLRNSHRHEIEVDHRANGANPTTESLDVQVPEESSIGAPHLNGALAFPTGQAMDPAATLDPIESPSTRGRTSASDLQPTDRPGSAPQPTNIVPADACQRRSEQGVASPRSAVVGGSMDSSQQVDSSDTPIQVLDFPSIPVVTRPRTHLQDNIVKPTKFTDGTVCYDRLSLVSTREP